MFNFTIPFCCFAHIFFVVYNFTVKVYGIRVRTGLHIVLFHKLLSLCVLYTSILLERCLP